MYIYISIYQKYSRYVNIFKSLLDKTLARAAMDSAVRHLKKIDEVPPVLPEHQSCYDA